MEASTCPLAGFPSDHANEMTFSSPNRSRAIRVCKSSKSRWNSVSMSAADFPLGRDVTQEYRLEVSPQVQGFFRYDVPVNPQSLSSLSASVSSASSRNSCDLFLVLTLQFEAFYHRFVHLWHGVESDVSLDFSNSRACSRDRCPKGLKFSINRIRSS